MDRPPRPTRHRPSRPSGLRHPGASGQWWSGASGQRRDGASGQGRAGAVPTVVLADPDEGERQHTRRLLRRAGFWVIAEATTAEEAVTAVIDKQPDLCLFEIDLPGGGARAISEVLIGSPEAVVVVYTDSMVDEDLFGALRAGAAGYLTKDDDADRLAASLRGVLAGEASLSRQLMRRVLKDYSTHPAHDDELLPRLTARERDVLELMRHDLTTREIADRLYVAPVTVRTHIASIRRKLDAPDRSALMSRHAGR